MSFRQWMAARRGRVLAPPGPPGIGRLFLWALIPGLLGLLVVLVDQYLVQRSHLEESAHQASRAFAAIVEGKLAVAEGKLGVLATSPFLRDGDLARFYGHAQEILASDDFIAAIVLTDEAGRQVINTLRPLGAGLPNTGHPDLVRRTFETGRPGVSGLYVGAAAGSHYVAVEVPVRQGGQVKYVLDAGIPVERLSEFLAGQELPPGWVATLLDGDGRILGRSQNARQFVGGMASDDLLAAMAGQGDGRLASHTLEGAPSFVAFSRSTPSGWTMSVGLSRSVLYARLYRPMSWIGLVLAMFVGVGLALAWLFTRKLQRALAGLGAATRAAGSGDLTATAPLAGPREIVTVAAQFNRLQATRRATVVELHRQREEISQLACHDPLTELPNRRLLGERLRQAMAEADRDGSQLAVCYLDLDGFKSINDLHGHDAGDAVLVEVARRIGSAVRSNDTVVRMGGDEFVLLLTRLDSTQEGQLVLKRLLDTIGQPLRVGRTHLVGLSASIGVATYPQDGSDGDALAKHADEAMYRAKRAGRNRIQAFASPVEPPLAAGAFDI